MRILLLTAALAVTPLRAGEPLTFKGFAIGAAREAVIAGLPKLAVPCKNDLCVWFPAGDCTAAYYRHEGVDPNECRRAFSYGGLLPTAVAYKFVDDKLVSARVNFDSSSFNDLASAMTQKFGRPDDDRPIDGQTFSWMRDGAILRLVKRGPKPDESFVSLLSVQYLKDAAADRERSVKERAKDL